MTVSRALNILAANEPEPFHTSLTSCLCDLLTGSFHLAERYEPPSIDECTALAHLLPRRRLRDVTPMLEKLPPTFQFSPLAQVFLIVNAQRRALVAHLGKSHSRNSRV
jgi:hypothetical protein